MKMYVLLVFDYVWNELMIINICMHTCKIQQHLAKYLDFF